MTEKEELKQKVMSAVAENGINTILFRNAMGKKLGLNLTEVQALSFLGIMGISTPSQISKHTGLTTGSTTTMLDRLEKKGFIKRKANKKDRRGVFIEINKKYSKIAFPLVSGIQKAHRDLIASYTDEELKIIESFLTGLINNLKENTNRIEENDKK